MGKLETTIILHDKFSDQLNKINKAITQTTSAMNRLNNLSGNGVSTKLNKVVQMEVKHGSQIRSNTQALRQQTAVLSQQVSQHDTIMKQMGRWATQLRNIATIYFGIRGAIEGVNKAVQLSDKMTMNDAKLNLVAGGDKNKKNELEAKTFAAAQRSTTDYLEFTKAVGKLGVLAGDKFKNNDSIVRFVELMNKSFQISGAETSERNAAMLQITQAIASNRLQGDEFRSILENAPMVMDALTKSLGVGHDQLKKLAKEGEITADVLIKAMFDAGAKIEEMYKTLPMTWERHWAKLKNVGVLAFKPVYEQLKRLFNSKQFTSFINGVCTAMIVLGNLTGKALKWIFDGLTKIPELFQKFKDWVLQAKDALLFLASAITAVTLAWTIYKGVQMAIVAWSKLQVLWTGFIAAAKTTLVTALLMAKLAMFAFGGATGFANMMTAILEVLLGNLAIIIAVVLVAALALWIYWIFQTSDSWIDACSRIVGGCYWMGALLTNIWYGVCNVVSGVVQAIVNTWDWCCNNIGTIFDNIGIWWSNLWISARSGFYSFINDVLTKLSSLAQKIQPLAELLDIDLSGLIGKAQASITGKINGLESQKKSYKSLTPFKSVDWVTNEYKSLDDAYDKGYGKTETFLNKAVDKYDEFKKQLEELKKVELGGQKVTADALNGLGDKLGDVGTNTGDTAKNTGDTAKNTSSKYEQDYSYLRNWAYQAGMGNSIGYNIKIEQNNRNNIGSNMDLNRVVDAVRDAIVEGILTQAEGVR